MCNAKRFKKFKSFNSGPIENKGFSLVEVLVAMVILAIIAIPVMRAFSNSSLINAKARQVENANTTASAIIEKFKSLNVEQLKELYKDNYEYDEESGIYYFNVTHKGSNDEDFAVKVKLDPSPYKDNVLEGDNEKNNINSYDVPRFTNIDEAKNFVIKDFMYKWDNDVYAEYSKNVKDKFDEKWITKTTEITVIISLNEDIGEKPLHASFVQKVEGKIIYSYQGFDDIVKEFTIPEGSDGEYKFNVALEDNKYNVSPLTGVKSIYLFCIPYDKYSTEYIEGSYLAKDKITVKYKYDDDINNIIYKDLNVFIVQQDVESVINNGHKVKLKHQNVDIYINESKIDLQSFGTIDLSKKIGVKGPVNIYSNINGWDLYKLDDVNRNNGLTQNSEKSDGDYLYSITIDVWLDKESQDNKEDALVTVKSTKEN